MEENIKTLETMLKIRKEQKEIIECAGGYCENCNPDIRALESAIQTMKAYKEIKEENDTLKKANNIAENVTIKDITQAIKKSLEDFNKEYIPVSSIIDKIEELDKDYEDCKDENEFYSRNYALNALQELLEKRK